MGGIYALPKALSNQIGFFSNINLLAPHGFHDVRNKK